ncbi:hypothetical protein PYW08_009166 [Mythimna loreyi]|uniref:Uncharacterized protein n=1 Tax=Mythimna loreyi TaxID=667449 RepID=A0ACC2Q8P2_9NEOP|nr:hypothetical protein PYW08_009166 [Mythimna loreyi]
MSSKGQHSIQIQPLSQDIVFTAGSQNIEVTDVAENKCFQSVDADIEHHISQHTTPRRLADEEKWTSWKPKSLHSKKHPALCAEKMKRPFERVADSKLEVCKKRF